MSKNVIFCYSGSGNCLDIAKNIASYLTDTDVIMMRSAPVKTDVTDAKRVGFVFPCYAGGLPGDVEKFVSQIKLAPDAYTFGVCSYAGYPGVGLSLIHRLVHLDYWAHISHHCSCIWLLPHRLMLPPMSVEKAQARSKKLCRKIAYDILDGRRKDKAPSANPLNALEAKAWPRLKDLKAAKMTVSDACVGCGQCARLCPRGNIRIEKGRAGFGASCIGCLSCLQYCPQHAISMGGATLTREHYHNPNVTADMLCQTLIHID